MGLENKTFDTVMFPQMTIEMRKAMVDEARLLFESIVRENRSMIDFVASDFTFLNGPLAALYGLDKNVTGRDAQSTTRGQESRRAF